MISKSNSSFKKLLKERKILVAEIGQAHEGSLNIAHSMIDACADAKVDVVKFQSHYAKYESTLEEPFRLIFLLKIKKDMITGKEWSSHLRSGKDSLIMQEKEDCCLCLQFFK